MNLSFGVCDQVGMNVLQANLHLAYVLKHNEGIIGFEIREMIQINERVHQ